MERKISTSDEHDHAYDHNHLGESYSSIRINPNWDKFIALVEVSEVERIKLAEIKNIETIVRQNPPTFLELGGAKGAKDLIKNNSNGVIKLPLPLHLNNAKTRVKGSLRKKQSLIDDNALLFKKPADQVYLFDLEIRHQEKDGTGHIRFSYEDITEKPVKRLRAANDENSIDKEEEIPRPKKAKKANIHLDGPLILPTVTIPGIFKNRILEVGGSEPSLVFVFEKVLTKTDVNPHQQRLLIPFRQVKNEFLTDGEKACFEGHINKFKIDALFIDPSLDECRMILRKWDMNKKDGKASYNYSLITYWSKVVQNNQLTEGMKVQLWAFRRKSELGLALVLV